MPLFRLQGFGIWHIHEDKASIIYVETIQLVFGARNVILLRVSSNDLIIVGGRNVYYNKSTSDIAHDRSITSNNRRKHPCEAPLLANHLTAEILRSASVQLPHMASTHRYALNCTSYFSASSSFPSSPFKKFGA